MARTMPTYPVQRHRLPLSSRRMRRSSASGSRGTMSRAVMSIPGVQNPHCSPCSMAKARRNAVMTGSFSNPSIVVMSAPWHMTA